jgi:carboxyl-terminal processing protease
MDRSTADLAAVGEVRELIMERWVEQPDVEQLRDGALEGMARRLDPFSDYISPQELEAFESQTSGKFGGLGIWVTIEEGYLSVIAPIEGTPAWDAGLLPGDLILRIDGEPTPEFANTSEAVAMLKGEVGSEVTLTVLHKGDDHTEDYTLERAIIQIKSVKGARILSNGVGYLRITAFNDGTVEEWGEAIERLQGEEMCALILDLRGNPGGYLHSATEVAETCLEATQQIVTTRARSGEVEQQVDAEEPRSVTVPMAVLVDGGSASASEILSGALQDNGVATVVGTRSYGKGSVQSLLTILGGTAQLKLTTQYFFTPNGRRIHRPRDAGPEDLSWGIVPDIEVAVDPRLRLKVSREESDREMDRLKARAGEDVELPPEVLHQDDPQVEAAFEHLVQVLAGAEELGEKRVISTPPPGVAPIDTGTTAAAPPNDEEAPEAPPGDTGD